MTTKMDPRLQEDHLSGVRKPTAEADHGQLAAVSASLHAMLGLDIGEALAVEKKSVTAMGSPRGAAGLVWRFDCDNGAMESGKAASLARGGNGRGVDAGVLAKERMMTYWLGEEDKVKGKTKWCTLACGCV